MQGSYQVVLVVKNPPADARDTRDLGLIPGLGRFPGVGNGNPLQYSSNPETTGVQTRDSHAQWRHFYSFTKNVGQGITLPSAQGVFSFFWSPPLFFRNLSSRPLSRSSRFRSPPHLPSQRKCSVPSPWSVASPCRVSELMCFQLWFCLFLMSCPRSFNLLQVHLSESLLYVCHISPRIS